MNETPVKRGWVRVLVLTILSFGLYSIYWFYVTRRDVFKEGGQHKSAFLHTLGLFVPILNFFIYYWLVKDVAELAGKVKAKEVQVPLLVLLWIFVSIAGQVMTQVSWNDYWDKKLGKQAGNIPIKPIEIVIVLISVLLWVVFWIVMIIVIILSVATASHFNSASDYLNKASQTLTTSSSGLPSPETVDEVRAQINLANQELDKVKDASLADEDYRRALKNEIRALDNYLAVYQQVYSDGTITSDEFVTFQQALNQLNSADAARQAAQLRSQQAD